MVLFHPELGNYTFEHHPNIHFNEGESIDFYCPICQAKLTLKRHESLASVLMKDQKGQIFEVLFSKIKGEKSTYCIIGESVEVYGEDNKMYVDFVNLSLTN